MASPFNILAAVTGGLDEMQQSRKKREGEQAAQQMMLEDRIAKQQMQGLQMRTLEEALKPKAEKPVEWDRVEAEDGMYQVNPVTGEKRPLGLRSAQKPTGPVRGTPEYIKAIQDEERARQAVRPQGPTPVQQDIAEQRKFQRTQALQQDYKNNASVKNGYELARVAGGLKAALAGESPMDDLSIVYETVKMFDPTSVVREGEIRLMNNAQSVPLQLRLMIEKWNSGRLLTPGMRAHISALLDRKLSESEKSVQPIQAEYGQQARRYGVEADSSFIAPSPFKGIKASKRSQLPNQD
jgi:hypothetical protein